MINGHALCPPSSFVRRCDPFPPGTAVERLQHQRIGGHERMRACVQRPGPERLNMSV
jgi:hypothetical protein